MKGALGIIISAFRFTVIFLMGISVFYGQPKDTARVLAEDGWIEKMSSKITADLSLQNNYGIFEVKTKENKILLYPNTPNNLRIKLNYEFLSLGLQFSPDFLPGNGDEELKGKTKSFQMGTGLIFRHWFSSLSYSNVKGFYLKNTPDVIPWEKGDPYIQFPNLLNKRYSFSLGYNSNSKYSLRSLSVQTERQLRNVGSFLPLLNMDYYIIDDQSGLPNTQKSDNIEVIIGPGYGYTYVFKEDFYLSLGLYAGLGYLNSHVTTRIPAGTYQFTQDNFIFRWDGKAGLGYNGRRVYSGLYSTVSGMEYRQENTTAMNFETRVFYHLFLGMRFDAPEFLDRQMARLRNTFPGIL